MSSEADSARPNARLSRTDEAKWRLQNFMCRAGIGAPYRIETDGKLRAFRGQDDPPGEQYAFYAFLIEPKPVGVFGSWRTGERHVFATDRDGRELDQAERDRLAAELRQSFGE